MTMIQSNTNIHNHQDICSSKPSDSSSTSNNTSSSSSGAGWTPLIYPSSALLQPHPHHSLTKLKLKLKQNHQQSFTKSSFHNTFTNEDKHTNDDHANNSNNNTASTYPTYPINPFFPLHESVLLATIRELLVLDESLNTNMTLNWELMEQVVIGTSEGEGVGVTSAKDSGTKDAMDTKACDTKDSGTQDTSTKETSTKDRGMQKCDEAVTTNDKGETCWGNTAVTATTSTTISTTISTSDSDSNKDTNVFKRRAVERPAQQKLKLHEPNAKSTSKSKSKQKHKNKDKDNKRSKSTRGRGKPIQIPGIDTPSTSSSTSTSRPVSVKPSKSNKRKRDDTPTKTSSTSTTTTTATPTMTSSKTVSTKTSRKNVSSVKHASFLQQVCQVIMELEQTTIIQASVSVSTGASESFESNGETISIQPTKSMDKSVSDTTKQHGSEKEPLSKEEEQDLHRKQWQLKRMQQIVPSAEVLADMLVELSISDTLELQHVICDRYEQVFPNDGANENGRVGSVSPHFPSHKGDWKMMKGLKVPKKEEDSCFIQRSARARKVSDVDDEEHASMMDVGDDECRLPGDSQVEGRGKMVHENVCTSLDQHTQESDKASVTSTPTCSTNQNNMISTPHISVIACHFDSQSFDLSTSIAKLYHHFQTTDHDRLLSHLAPQHSTEPQFISSTQLDSTGEQRDWFKLPQQLDVSILLESQLRTLSYKRMSRMVKTFHNKSLFEFLGYKSSLLTRERMLQLISEFVFEVSHAMFAWDQTANGMTTMSPLGGGITSSSGILHVPTATDKKICKMLFQGDRSVLSRLGGFDNQSLLVQALSIQRLRQRHVSDMTTNHNENSNSGILWQDFAKTVAGKKLFRHHRDDSSRMKAGQKRRQTRMRNKVQPLCSIFSAAASAEMKRFQLGNDANHLEEYRKMEEQLVVPTVRSRSSSVVSAEGGDIIQSMNESAMKMATASPAHANAPAASFTVSKISDSKINDIDRRQLTVTLTREEGKSWGILLARGGDDGSTCIVMRVPDNDKDAMDERNKQSKRRRRLRIGDVILTIQNDSGDTLDVSRSCNTSSGETCVGDWFPKAVDLFKKSHKLRLTIQRIK